MVVCSEAISVMSIKVVSTYLFCYYVINTFSILFVF
jgi:hypothetical protein